MIAISQRIKKFPWVNIQDHGGVGDDEVECDAAFADSIAKLPAEGGVLIVPPERAGNTIYKITAPITFGNKPIHLMTFAQTQINVANPSTVIIKNYGDDDAILINPNAIVGRSTIESLEIIDGHGSRTNGDGIHAERAGVSGNLSVDLNKVIVRGHLNGFGLVRCLLSNLRQCLAVDNDNHGYLLASVAGGSGTSIKLEVCFGNGNAADGFHVDGHSYCSLVCCAADGNVNGYVFAKDNVTNPIGHSLFGCGAESNTGVGVILSNSQSAMGIIGGAIISSGGDGIQPNEAFNVTIQGVKLVANGGWGINCDNTIAGKIVLINNNYSANTLGEVNDPNNLVTRIADGVLGHLFSSYLAAFGDSDYATKPGYIKMRSCNGSMRYMFVEDDGTLKLHDTIPIQNSDGIVVGSQT